MIHAPDPDTSDRDIVLSRTFLAPRELVWAAWTDPEQVGTWWGPHGFTTTTHRIDVRPGGLWIYDMHGPDGTTYPNWIRYLEITPPHRLVYDHGGEDPETPVLFRTTVDFSERDGRTTVRMRSVFPTAVARDAVVERYGAIEGGKQHLAALEAHLATRSAATSDTRGDRQTDAVGHVTFTTTRDIRAPIDHVFAAISNPDRLARWWGPAGFTNTFAVCDFVNGGRWSFTMHSPDGQQYPNENTFAHIRAPHEVVILHQGEPRKSLTIALSPLAAGTRVTWTHVIEDAVFAERIAPIIVPANEQNLDRLTIEVLGEVLGEA